MKRPLILLVSVLTLLPTGTSAFAAGSPVTERHTTPMTDLHLDPGALVMSGRGDDVDLSAPSARIKDLLAETIDPTDVLTQMDAVRLAIALDTGIRLPDLRPAHTRSEGDRSVLPEDDEVNLEGVAAAEEEPEETGNLAWPSPAGDLTGDGLDDLLSLELKLPEETLKLRALRGTDGSELWRVTLEDIADAVWLPEPDLTGDGIDDFLLLGLDIQSESFAEDCPEEGDHCMFGYEADYSWLYGVLSGVDGSVAWTRTVPGSEDYHFLVEAQDDDVEGHFHLEETLDSTNVSVFPFVHGDHDGDGLEDLALESIDLDFDIDVTSDRTVVVYEDSGSFDVESQTRAEVFNGAEGSLLSSRVSTPAPAIATIWPAGDMVGDASLEFLWSELAFTPETYECLEVAGLEHCADEPEYAEIYSVEALDGETMQPAWRTNLAGLDALARPLEGDINSDGRSDVTVFVFPAGDGTAAELRILSGADGSLLWKRVQPVTAFWPEFPIAVESYGGGPGADLLTVSFVQDQATGNSEGVRLSRVDGATGGTISETNRRLHEPVTGEPDMLEVYTYVTWPSDFDGDSRLDVLAGGYQAQYDCDDVTFDCALSQIGSAAIIESGRTSTLLYERKKAGGLFFAENAGDLDGDGRADTMEWEIPIEGGGPYDVAAKTVVPARTMWGRSFTEDEYWWGYFWPSGDHDGEGEDIIYGFNEPNGNNWRASIASVKGSTGAERWRIEL